VSTSDEVQPHPAVDVGADRLRHDKIGRRRDDCTDRHEVASVEVRRRAHATHPTALRMVHAREIRELCECPRLEREPGREQQLGVRDVGPACATQAIAVCGDGEL